MERLVEDIFVLIGCFTFLCNCHKLQQCSRTIANTGRYYNCANINTDSVRLTVKQDWALIEATLQAIPQDLLSTSLSTYNDNIIVPTQTPTPVVAPGLPAPTSFPIDFDSLPKLYQVIISSLDLQSIKDAPGDDHLAYLLDTNPLIDVTDVIHELNECLWDCAKYRYSLKTAY